jgi:hypothetical protein
LSEAKAISPDAGELAERLHTLQARVAELRRRL